MKHWPLRNKVALWTALLVFVVVGGFGLGVAWHLHWEMISDIDKEMKEMASEFYHELEERNYQVNWGDKGAVEDLLPAVRRLYLGEVREPGGSVLYLSRRLLDTDLAPLVAAPAFETVKVHGKGTRLGAFEHNGYRLRIFADTRAANEVRKDLIRVALFAGPVVLLLVGFGGWCIAGRALRPVREAAAAAEAITAQRLDQRLPMPPTRDEIGHLTGVLNKMIDRLEASFHQATRFSADASHELRTPLTIIRGEIEDALRDPQLPVAQARLLANLLEETERLAAIADGLLLLSLADAGRFMIDRSPLDLSALLNELVEDTEILASTDEIRIETDIPPGITLDGHKPFLRQLFVNLLDNAIKYNEPRGTVRLQLTSENGMRIVSIGNTGKGVTKANAEHIFERFYRGEAARNSRHSGHGLGLSICREIARAHDGETTLHNERAGWTEFRVTLSAIPQRDEATVYIPPSGRAGTEPRSLAPAQT